MAARRRLLMLRRVRKMEAVRKEAPAKKSDICFRERGVVQRSGGCWARASFWAACCSRRRLVRISWGVGTGSYS